MANVGKNARAKMAKEAVLKAMSEVLTELDAINVGGPFDWVVPVTNEEGITTFVGLTLTAKNDVNYEKDGEVVLAAYDPGVAIAKYVADQEIKEAKKAALAAERAAAKEAKAKEAKVKAGE